MKTPFARSAGVPWKELNTHYRNDYDRTLEEVLQDAHGRGYDVDAIRAAAAAVLEAVRKLAPVRVRDGVRRVRDQVTIRGCSETPTD